MLSVLWQHELLTFVRRGPALLVLSVIVTAIFYAGWSGEQRRDRQAEGVERFAEESAAELALWVSDLQRVEAGDPEMTPSDANPMGISYPAILPPTALGDFAAGHADLQPLSAELSLWRNLSELFGRYQFDNPQYLLIGAFDVALVVVALMPLLMIAVSFDVLARERQRGTLAMALCAPVTLARFVWSKLLFRNLLLWLLAVCSMVVLAVVGADGNGGDRFPRFLAWLCVSFCYGAFWLGLIALVLSRAETATHAVTVMIALWFVLTLAIPGLVSTTSEAVYPTPSRLALLSKVRQVEAETNRELAELTDQFLTDHPELTVGDEGMPSFYRASYLANDAAREVAAPIIQSFDGARRGRERALSWAQYFSPAIVGQRLFHQLAGVDLQRYHQFQVQARTALFALGETVGPAVVSRNRLSFDEFRQIEPFAFADRSVGDIARSAIMPLGYLLCLSGVFCWLAHRRFRRN